LNHAKPHLFGNEIEMLNSYHNFLPSQYISVPAANEREKFIYDFSTLETDSNGNRRKF
jgi:hypothetical protein